MAQDYNIYVYSQKSTSSSNANLKPVENQSDEEKENSVAGNIQSFISGSQNAVNFINGGAGQMAISKIAKASPWAAAAIAVAVVVDKILTIGAGHLETYTGRYEMAVNMQNINQSISNALNPVGMLYNQYKWNKQNEVYNRRISEQNKLFGQSVLNTEIKGV